MKSLKLVYDLIYSLEKEEKRFFKLQARAKSAQQKKYLQLYDILEQAKTYQQEELKEQFREAEIKDLHVKIPYLRDLIIKSLIAQHAHKTIDGQLNLVLEEARLMQQRGFMDRYLKMLGKAKRIAYRYERFSILLEILQKEILYTFNYGSKQEVRIKELFKEIDSVQKNIDELRVYQRILNSSFLQFRIRNRTHSPGRKKNFLSKKERSLLKTEKEPSSFWAIIKYFSAKAIIQRLDNTNLELIKENQQQVIDRWENHPHMKVYNPKLYKIHLFNYLNSCHMLGEYDQFKPIQEKMQAIPAYTLKDEVENFQNIVYVELLFVMNNFDMKKARALIAEILSGLRKYKGKMNRTRELGFISNIAVLNFVLEDFADTSSYTQRIKEYRKIAGREDIHLFANIMYLMAFYEMNKENAQAMESTLANAARSIKRKGGLYDFETIMLKLFDRLALNLSDKEKESLFRTTYEKLQKLEEDKTIAYREGFSEASIWLESKLSKQSFVTVLKQRALARKK